MTVGSPLASPGARVPRPLRPDQPPKAVVRWWGRVAPVAVIVITALMLILAVTMIGSGHRAGTDAGAGDGS